MQKSIQSFSFDRAKAGQICKRYIDNSPYSQRQIAQLVGMSDDMLSNVLRGQNKEISLERIFKICLVTKNSVCGFIREMLEDEDIDFRAEFEAICPPHAVNPAEGSEDSSGTSVDFAGAAAENGVVVRKTQVIAQQTEVLEEHGAVLKSLNPDILSFLRADRQEQADRNNEIHQTYTARLVDQYKDQLRQLKDSRQITIDHYEDRIAVLREEHEKRIKDIKDSHDRSVEYLKAENKRLQKWAVRLGVILGIETAAIVGLFMYDAMNRNVGWFRGLFTNFSGTEFQSVKS